MCRHISAVLAGTVCGRHGKFGHSGDARLFGCHTAGSPGLFHAVSSAGGSTCSWGGKGKCQRPPTALMAEDLEVLWFVRSPVSLDTGLTPS
jgi:hypothetical protein